MTHLLGWLLMLVSFVVLYLAIAMIVTDGMLAGGLIGIIIALYGLIKSAYIMGLD